MTKEEILQKVRFHGEVRGLSHHTIDMYYTKAKVYQDYYNKPASELDVTHIQQFIHYLMYEKKLAAGSINTYNSGLRFLYNVVLDTPLNLFKIPCLRNTRKYPEILTRDEVRAVFGVCGNLRDRAMLMTAYGAGLRVNEVASLHVSDIDSQNMQIYIQNGKGAKDRYALLSQTNLEILREYWLEYRPREWLFYALRQKHAKSHITSRGVQEVFYKAVSAAGINKEVSIHTLRHSFATHLLEDGVSIYHIKQLLGHADISTTCFYIHLLKIQQLDVTSPLDKLEAGKANA